MLFIESLPIMILQNSLTSRSLDSLLQMFAVGTQNLVESKRDCKDHDMTLVYERVLDSIQKAIVTKQAEFLTLK